MKIIKLISAAPMFLLTFIAVVAQPITGTTEGANSIESAEGSFRYIASTLETFRETGRLVNNPGIDGSDFEAFIDLLNFYYDRFSNEFNPASAMCEFYRDPENSRMTVKERAGLSFSFLRGLENRIELYTAVDEEFQMEIADEFGTFLLDNINALKAESLSDLQLPLSQFDEKASIAFVDSVCR